jgi:hypothetical protein
MKSVLDSGGHFDGYNRKVQIKALKVSETISESG